MSLGYSEVLNSRGCNRVVRPISLLRLSLLRLSLLIIYYSNNNNSNNSNNCNNNSSSNNTSNTSNSYNSAQHGTVYAQSPY